MNLTDCLARIARDLRDGIPTDMPRQSMDYAARRLEAMAALPIPEIESVADAGGNQLIVHLKSPPTVNQVRGLQVLLTGEL